MKEVYYLKGQIIETPENFTSKIYLVLEGTVEMFWHTDFNKIHITLGYIKDKGTFGFH